MQAEMEYVKMAEKLMNETVDAANVAMAQSAVALDTMLQLQSDERKEKDKAFLEAIENMQKRHAEEMGETRKHYQKIILAIALALLLIVGSLIGGVIYVVSNFDFEFEPSYSQDISAEGGGDATIEDGIHINDWKEPQE